MILTTPTAIVLDTRPLGLLTMRRHHQQGDPCRAWMLRLEAAGHRFYVPEIADYELRRELIRANKQEALRRLDAFNVVTPDRYLSLTTTHVRQAARLWADLRNKGLAGAPMEALDGDVLIVAQARLLPYSDFGLTGVIVATENVSHMAHLTRAAMWSNITA